MAQAAPAPHRTHSFAKKTFHKPTYCHHCSDLLWGLIGQGYGCEGTRRACAPRASIPAPRARRHDQRVMQPGARGSSGPRAERRPRLALHLIVSRTSEVGRSGARESRDGSELRGAGSSSRPVLVRRIRIGRESSVTVTKMSERFGKYRSICFVRGFFSESIPGAGGPGRGAASPARVPLAVSRCCLMW